MSEVKKIATRDSYGNALVELGKEHENLIVLDADLAGATKTCIFQKEFPERHWDCGIAECNMTGIAAGLSTCGKVPFISSFAMFAAGRNYEQVRNSIGYPHLNVKIGATHAGISVGEDGATHQCLEDLALMREIPGMVVINPSDDVEARAAVHAAYDYVGPVYLRFGRLAVPVSMTGGLLVLRPKRYCINIIYQDDHPSEPDPPDTDGVASSFSDRNSCMGSSDLYIQMRISDGVANLLIVTSGCKHCKRTDKRNFPTGR